MKITIDTKEDSREEIQKAIRLLQSLVNQAGSSEYHEGSYPEGESVFGNILDTPTESSETEEKKPEEFSIKNFETY